MFGRKRKKKPKVGESLECESLEGFLRKLVESGFESSGEEEGGLRGRI